MMMDAIHIPVKNGDFNAALTGSLAVLLDKKVVDALLIPQESVHGTSINQTLVKKASGLKRARPINFVMPVNSAKLLQLLSETEPDEKIAVVLRPCELRAAIELVKLNQINRTNILFIAQDCLGTFRMKVYDKKAIELRKAGQDPTTGLATACQTMLRDNCWACEFFWPMEGTADLVVAHLGGDITKDLFMEAHSDLGKEALKALEGEGYKPGKLPESRKSEITRRSALNAEFRKKWFAETKQKMGTLDGMLETLSTCIRCYNCRDACPICYCKECIFDAEFMKPTARGMLRKAGYQVIEARSAEEAIPLAREHGSRIRLLLSDVMMPGMNGPELARRLVAEMPGLKVLFISGYPDEVLEQKGVLGKGVQLLMKPFTSDALAQKVREVLDSAQ